MSTMYEYPNSTNNQRAKQRSHENKNSSTNPTSGRPHGKSRYAKKRNANKRSKPVVKREKAFEYISGCCNLPARKAPAAQKVALRDPETGRTKEVASGLGKWRCSGCGKKTKVSRRKPTVVLPEGSQYTVVFTSPSGITVVGTGSVEGADLGRGTAVTIAN